MITPPDGPALLLLDIITSEVRNCARASSRIGALQPLLDLCRYITDEEVLDRMVPYIVYLTKDDTPQVRAESCRVLVAMVSVRIDRYAVLGLNFLANHSWLPSPLYLPQTRISSRNTSYRTSSIFVRTRTCLCGAHMLRIYRYSRRSV